MQFKQRPFFGDRCQQVYRVYHSELLTLYEVFVGQYFFNMNFILYSCCLHGTKLPRPK